MGPEPSCVDFLNAAGEAVASGCRDRSGGVIGGQIVIAGKLAVCLAQPGRLGDLSNQRQSLLFQLHRTETNATGLLPARSATP